MNEEIRQRLENLEEHKGSKLVSPNKDKQKKQKVVSNTLLEKLHQNKLDRMAEKTGKADKYFNDAVETQLHHIADTVRELLWTNYHDNEDHIEQVVSAKDLFNYLLESDCGLWMADLYEMVYRDLLNKQNLTEDTLKSLSLYMQDGHLEYIHDTIRAGKE